MSILNGGASNLDGRELSMQKADRALSERELGKEMELLLAEKRTSLAVLRSGIFSLLLPLSVFSFLLITWKMYGTIREIHLLLPLVLLSLALTILGFYLIGQALKNLRQIDGAIREVKGKMGWLDVPEA
ncbi:MAG: hypothetical protein ACWGQW_11770 [bacterium]